MGWEKANLHQDGPPSLTWNKIFQFAFVWNSDFYQDTYLLSLMNIVFILVTDKYKQLNLRND